MKREATDLRVVESVPLVTVDGTPQVKAFLEQPAQANHIVQFYEDEDFLCDNVAHFLGAGLTSGEPVIVIATEAHRRAFSHRLRLNALDVERALASGQLVMLDARETLATFLVDGMPDWDLFRTAIGAVIARSRLGRGDAPVRAYGEMVDLLWRDGNKQGAIALEGLWNDLGAHHSFSLLCAYVMGNFYNSTDGERFLDVCRAHSHVIPTEGYSRIAAPDDRLREISMLQQRARSLENEIEHRKELEEALRESLAVATKAREEAERNVHFNEMFAAMLGHDLRNPLNAITMGANFIARINSGEKATRAATRILSSAERMARMIDQLLDFARIRVGGGFALTPTRFDLADLCGRIKDELEAAHPDCFIALDLKGNSVGEWDYDRLLQVFSNLAGNAVTHGGSGCRVSIETDGTAASNVVVITHNEGFVPPGLMPVLFDPFRGSAKQQRSKGLGLGLFITRQIVAAHGGTIEARSSEAEGTTFRVQLPRVIPAARPLDLARRSP